MTIIDYSRLSERELVQLTQDGDDAAFTDLVNNYRSPLYGHAMRRLHDVNAAEDALQETFLRAYKGLANFSGEYKVGPWLHRIMENVCVDEGNRRRREADKYDRVLADPQVVELSPGVEDQLGLHIDDAGVNEALASLPANYQEALILRFVEGLEYEEVAAVAGVSEQNARARVSRARSAARAMLRGVAAFPLFMVGLFRRGERPAAAALQAHSSTDSLVDHAQSFSTGALAGGGAAAGAATAAGGAMAGGAVGTATTAATAVATPLLSKAAIGVGLAVAVAVPTAGPQIVDRVTRSAPVVAESAEGSSASLQDAVALAGVESADSAMGNAEASTSGLVTADDGALAHADQTEAVKNANEVAGVVTLPNVGTPSTSHRSDNNRAEVVPPENNAANVIATPVERFSGSIEGNGLRSAPAGPRLDVNGIVQVAVNGIVTDASLNARFELPEWPAPPVEGDTAEANNSGEQTEALTGQLSSVDAKRMSANMTLVVAGGESVSVRLAGHAQPLTDAPWGTVSFSGQFTSTSSSQVALATSGTFSGSWNPATGIFKLALNR